jgi:hypothetical protein
MQLVNYINKSILEYPCLFRGENYEYSRLLVLNHIFLTVGCGVDVLKICEQEDVDYILPKDYFEKKLWTFSLKDFEKWEELNFQGYYNIKHNYCYIEGKKDHISDLIKDCDNFKGLFLSDASFLNQLKPVYDKGFCFLSEVIDKNIKLNADWLNGMKEIVEFALNYYLSYKDNLYGFIPKNESNDESYLAGLKKYEKFKVRFEKEYQDALEDFNKALKL